VDKIAEELSAILHVLALNFEDTGKFFRYIADQIAKWYNFPILYIRKGAIAVNYRTIEDFIVDWNLESGLTMKVLEALTDESLKQTVSEAQQRTLGELAWHLVGAIPVLLGAGGLQIDAPSYETPTPTSAAEIADRYRRMSEVAMTALKEQWTDGKLAEGLSLFGFIDTTYSGLLSLVVKHQIHHRGQMTILMRQAGVVPPGVYGPNEEESAALRAAREQK